MRRRLSDLVGIGAAGRAACTTKRRKWNILSTVDFYSTSSKMLFRVARRKAKGRGTSPPATRLSTKVMVWASGCSARALMSLAAAGNGPGAGFAHTCAGEYPFPRWSVESSTARSADPASWGSPCVPPLPTSPCKPPAHPESSVRSRYPVGTCSKRSPRRALLH